MKQVHFIIRAALDRAVRWRYLSANEAALAEPPAFERSGPDPPLTEEIAALLNEAWRDPDWGLFLWLLMVTGCRRGEMCALRRTDLDLLRRVMTVDRSYPQTSSVREETTTKTRQKRRSALDAHTVDLLTAYRERCRKQCEALDLDLARDGRSSPAPRTSRLPCCRALSLNGTAGWPAASAYAAPACTHFGYSATELLTVGVDLRTVAGRPAGSATAAAVARRCGSTAAWVDEADHRGVDAIANTMPAPDPSSSSLYHYELLVTRLRLIIASGEVSAGDMLPSTVDLAAKHRVSVGTVIRAVAVLESEGLVVARLTRNRHLKAVTQLSTE